MVSKQTPEQWDGKRQERRQQIAHQISPEELDTVDRLWATALSAGAKVNAKGSSLNIEVQTTSRGPVTIGWMNLPNSDPKHAMGTAAVFGWLFTSQKTRPYGPIRRILDEWAQYFEASGFAEVPVGWVSQGNLPNARWQVAYEDLPAHWETISSWMVDVIEKLRNA